jgi:TM2 domain-containing membrane protein YozV
MRDPGLAAVLSAIIPGVGQFYNGRILAGILWLIITPGLWIGTGGLLGWVCSSLWPTPLTRMPVITRCVPEV